MSALTDLTAWLAARSPHERAKLLATRPTLASVSPDDPDALAAAVMRDQYACQLLHGLTLAEHDVLGAAVSLAEGTRSPHPAKASRLAPLEAYRGGASTIIRVNHLVASVAGSERPMLATAARHVIDTLLERLLLWPAGTTGIRVPMLIRNCTGPRLAAPTVERALTAHYAKEPVARIAAALLPGTAASAPGEERRVRGTGPTREHLQREVVAMLTDPARVRAVAAQAPPAASALLQQLLLAGQLEVVAANLPDALLQQPGPDRLSEAVRWLAEHGLLVPSRRGRARLPREIAHALGGAAYDFAACPPMPATTPRDRTRVSGEAQLALTTAAALIELLGATLSSEPAALRKDGALAVRELRRLATTLKIPPAQARFWIELAYAADLLTVNPGTRPRLDVGRRARRSSPSSADDGGPTLAPSSRYRTWLTQAPHARLVPLITTWLSFPGLLTWQAPGQDTPATLACPEDRCATGLRRAVLSCLATLPTGVGLAELPDTAGSDRAPEASPALVRTVTWHRPDCIDEHPAERIAATLTEAQLLGASALGALTDVGDVLHTHLPVGDCAQRPKAGLGDALAETLAPLLPTPQNRAHFQADLTAVVTGLPSADLAALLDLVGVREASGHAGVWRLSQATLRRALDTGADPDELQQRLRQAAHAALPQPVEYLLADAARRHGHLRVVPAGCCLRGDDAVLLAEVASSNHRALRLLRLRQIAPTVLVSAEPPAATVEALRAAGYAPILDEGTGTIGLRPKVSAWIRSS
ncbi:helicase-associated domain-containing protein [Nonomuraea polychroma]|uniref:helicase-associated domain-containing protein n=1 Tax=Nonomuraea polychroma TaxID=46176 RepID=UPI003D94DC77